MFNAFALAVLLCSPSPAVANRSVVHASYRHTCVVVAAHAPAKARVVVADASARRQASVQAAETLSARIAHRHSAAR